MLDAREGHNRIRRGVATLVHLVDEIDESRMARWSAGRVLRLYEDINEHADEIARTAADLCDSGDSGESTEFSAAGNDARRGWSSGRRRRR